LRTRSSSADRLPDPPPNQRHQHPQQQCPKDHQHQQDNQRRDGSALGECLRPIGHKAPAGWEWHWLKEVHAPNGMDASLWKH